MINSHAITRAKERYGLDMTGADLTGIAKACVEGRAMLVETMEGDAKVYLARLGGKVTYPLISPNGLLITFMPLTRYSSVKASDRSARSLWKGKPRPAKTRGKVWRR